MNTTLSYKDQTVHIGPDHPFVIIGERINPTGRQKLVNELTEGVFKRVEADGRKQIEAGATVLDINVTIPSIVDETSLMVDVIQHVLAVTPVPLALDTIDVGVLEAALPLYDGKPLINGVTGEADQLDTVLPLAAEHGAAVIGVCSDESGIPDTPEGRLTVAQRIVERAESHGIPRSDVLIDPIVMPISANSKAANTTLRTVQLCQAELGINTCCGASNVSFGLPDRKTVNATFLAMLIAAGMRCAITNPLSKKIRRTVLAADMLAGHDDECERWLFANERGADREARRIARQAERRQTRQD